MKTCSLDSFLEELKPWLTDSYVRKAAIEKGGRFTLYFLDGTKNVYQVDDCSMKQVKEICSNLEKEGVAVEFS